MQEASTYTRENREETEGSRFRLAELNETVSNQAITIHQLYIEVEDLKNRSFRKTLVFRNIKKQQSQKTLDDTKMVLANEISKHMRDFSKEEIIKNIEQAHRITTTNRNPLPHQHHLFLLPKLQIGTCQKKLNLLLLKLTRKVNWQYLSRRCTQSLWQKKNCCSEVPSRSQSA